MYFHLIRGYVLEIILLHRIDPKYGFGTDEQDTLVQVLQLTPDQINGLDAEQRASIMQLVCRHLPTSRLN